MRIFSNSNVLTSIKANINANSPNNVYDQAVFGLFKVCMRELYRIIMVDAEEISLLFASRQSMMYVIHGFSVINFSDLFVTIVQTSASSTNDQQEKNKRGTNTILKKTILKSKNTSFLC